MRVTYNTKQSAVTIRLSLTEVRQFLSNVGIGAIKDAIYRAMSYGSNQ